ncbi:hypothetical protein VKT23_019249 [Stygiomarasmius scandens]|uniref:BTB domain-containing protein n=1 Tax=Marasmiellus scandens TaxID=2682957 RepID=A0ABR1IQ18_9AGAR
MKDSDLFPPRPGADVVFQSSDDVLFHLDPKHLELSAEAFPPVGKDTAIPDKPVPLVENSVILELLFQFTSHKNQPDLEDLDFETLMELAEVAEKYVVYSAIRNCVMKMKDFIPAYTQQIFQFASKHNHEVLFCSIAPRFVSKPLADVAYTVPLNLYVPWTLYHEQWTEMIDKINKILLKYTYTGEHERGWQSSMCWVRDTIINEPLELGNFLKLFKLCEYRSCTSKCCSHFVSWRQEMIDHISAMRDFKSFVREYKSQKSG